MDKAEAVIKAEHYIESISTIIRYDSAYMFGSYIHGTQRKDSDIDIAIFVEKIDDEYMSLLKKMYKARRAIDSRIEPHLFVSNSDVSGFAGEIKRDGLRIK